METGAEAMLVDNQTPAPPAARLHMPASMSLSAAAPTASLPLPGSRVKGPRGVFSSQLHSSWGGGSGSLSSSKEAMEVVHDCHKKRGRSRSPGKDSLQPPTKQQQVSHLLGGGSWQQQQQQGGIDGTIGAAHAAGAGPAWQAVLAAPQAGEVGNGAVSLGVQMADYLQQQGQQRHHPGLTQLDPFDLVAIVIDFLARTNRSLDAAEALVRSWLLCGHIRLLEFNWRYIKKKRAIVVWLKFALTGDPAITLESHEAQAALPATATATGSTKHAFLQQQRAGWPVVMIELPCPPAEDKEASKRDAAALKVAANTSPAVTKQKAQQMANEAAVAAQTPLLYAHAAVFLGWRLQGTQGVDLGWVGELLDIEDVPAPAGTISKRQARSAVRQQLEAVAVLSKKPARVRQPLAPHHGSGQG